MTDFPFVYRNNELHIEELSLRIIAQEYGTPCYVYSRKSIESAWQQYAQAILPQETLICYAVKANSNLAILQLLAQQGAGFDIVSGGELARCLAAGVLAQRIVYSGVGKTAAEISQAMKANILMFNVESIAELKLLAELAQSHKKRIKISLRINPNINVNTHPYIATGLQEHKFGLTMEEALANLSWLKTQDYLQMVGIACHIGSEIQEIAPFKEATECLLMLVKQFSQQGVQLSTINLGGGLGIHTDDIEKKLTIKQLCHYLRDRLSGLNLQLILEPGRSIVGKGGGLLTKVLYLKDNGKKRFAIVDAGMNDLLRPALYGAEHPVLPVQYQEPAKTSLDIVGPVCESADFLAKEKFLSLTGGDLLTVMHAGAYGFSMSSHYNSRPKPGEVLVDKQQHYLVRAREEVSSLFSLEKTVPFK